MEKTKISNKIEELYQKRQELHLRQKEIKEQIDKDSHNIYEKRKERNSNITNMKLKSNLKIISYQNKINEIKDHIYKLKKLVL